MNQSPIPISQIRLPELLLRESYENVKELEESISKNGLLYPIMLRVCPHGQTFPYEVVAGCRRFTAIKNLGRKELSPNEYFLREIDEKLAFEISLIENLQRGELTPQEEAKAFYQYCKVKGYGSVHELAKKIDKSEPYVSHRIRLLNLPESEFKQIGVLTNFSVSHAEALTHADLPPNKIEEIVDLISYKALPVDKTVEIIADQTSHPETTPADSLLKIETDRANEPYRIQAQEFQATQDTEDEDNYKNHQHNAPKVKDDRLDNLERLELTAARFATEMDTWIRRFEDSDPAMYKKIVSEFRYPLHNLVGVLATIRKEYARQIKLEAVAS